MNGVMGGRRKIFFVEGDISFQMYKSINLKLLLNLFQKSKLLKELNIVTVFTTVHTLLLRSSLLSFFVYLFMILVIVNTVGNLVLE